MAPSTPEGRGLIASRNHSRVMVDTMNDAAIARALCEDDESEQRQRREEEGEERRGPGEAMMMTMTDGDAWWDGDDRTEIELRSARRGGPAAASATMRDACTELLSHSMEIARRVSDAGIRGVHAITPRQRLPYAVLRGGPRPPADERAEGHRPTGDDGDDDDDPAGARRRLSSLLLAYSLTELRVRGDGNCQYRSLAVAIYGRESDHDVVREIVVAQLARDPLRYRDFVLDVGWTDYVAGVAELNTWGDHITLQAASDAYGLQINLLTSFASEPMIEVRPLKQKSARVVWLSFWAEVHYNAIAVPT